MAFSSDYRTHTEISDENGLVQAQGAFKFKHGMLAPRDKLRRALERAVELGLLQLPAEFAHKLTLQLINFSQVTMRRSVKDDERLARKVFGLNFPNPIGVAAGIDKDAQAFSAFLENFGFGSVEVGTVTPQRQPGNPKPRVFRLHKDHGVINRFGFNSAGEEEVLRRLVSNGPAKGIVGVNIGANKDSVDRVADYLRLIEAFAPIANYFTVNVSSPNTPGLRDLQRASALDDLLARIVAARDRVASRAGPTPVLLKIAPDVSLTDLDDIVGIARTRGIDGMIVGNTTLARPPTLRDRSAVEVGGLSGRPLYPLSTRMLAETYVRVEGAFPLIGAGGIDSGKAALGKVRAGADLLQLYSALVFNGMGLIAEIKAAILDVLDRGEAEKLSDLVGVDAAAMTAEQWPL